MNPARTRILRCALWLLLAGFVHGLAVWALPRVIMRGAMSRLVPVNAAVADEHVRVLYPPLTTAASRQIVLPSPDLAYALCVYDLRQGPVDVDAAPAWPGYWSVALYADNTDNYLVRNDRVASTRPVHWRLALAEKTGAATADAATASGRELVLAPSARGLLLLRVLVADRHGEATAAAQAQRSLHCVAVP